MQLKYIDTCVRGGGEREKEREGEGEKERDIALYSDPNWLLYRDRIILYGVLRNRCRKIDDDDRYTLFATPYGGRYTALNSFVPRRSVFGASAFSYASDIRTRSRFGNIAGVGVRQPVSQSFIHY